MNRDTSAGGIRQLSPEAMDIEKQLSNIEAKRDHIAELKLTLETLRVELGRFEKRYYAKIGGLYVELDKLELQIDEYKARIGLLMEKGLSASQIEEKMNERFAERREDTRFYEEQAHEHREAFERQKLEARLSDEEEAELKRLYRRLVKFVHPDLADSDKERSQKNKTMAEVNAAYKERDLEKLKVLEKAAKEEEARKHETTADKLVRLTRESMELDKEIERLLTELEELKESPTFNMKEAVEEGATEGRDILEELANDLQEKIEEKRIELYDVIREYREITTAA